MPKWMPWLLVVLAVAVGGYLIVSAPSEEPADATDAGTQTEDPAALTDGTGAAPAEGPALRTTDAPAKAPAAQTPVVPIPDGGLRVVGTLHAADGTPSAGTTVDVQVGLLGSAPVTTNDAGRFAVPVAAEIVAGQWWGVLRARQGSDALFHRFQLRSGPRTPEKDRIGPEIDLGTLTLEAGHALDLEAATPTGASGAVTFAVYLADMGAHVRHSHAEADAAGRATITGLPQGTWRVLATAEGAGRGEAYVKVPQSTPETVRIELPEERTAAVAVVDKETQEPIAGASLEVYEFVQMPTVNTTLPLLPRLDGAVTDAQGRFVFRGLNARSSLTLYIAAEGYPTTQQHDAYGRQVAAVAHIRRGQDDVRVELQKARTIRWPVVASDELPVPAEGTTIKLRTNRGGMGLPGDAPPMPSGVIQDGALVVEGIGPGHTHAMGVAPDGSLARLFCKDGETDGMETSFIPARKLEVTLRYPDGEPVVGMYVLAANQGNNPLAAPTPTGDDGRAVIEGFYGGKHSLAEVRVSESSQAWGGLHIGSIDFTKGDGRLEATIKRSMPVTLRIRIAGEPRLPPITEKAPTGGVSWTMQGQYQFPDHEVDEAKAEIRFSWRPPPGELTEAHVSVSLAGYLPFTTKVPAPASPQPIAIDVDLALAGSIHVTGKPPADGRRQRIQPQKWNPDTKSWGTAHLPMMSMGGFAKVDAEGQCVLTPLEEGRYRVIDVANFVATEAVDVVPGGEPPRVVLDASKAGFVKGTVVAPEGTDLTRLLIRTEGGPDFGNPFMGRVGGAPLKGHWARVAKSGEFWLRVPGTKSMRIHAEGLGLLPAADGGYATVKAPKEGVTLVVQKGAVAHARFAKPLLINMNRGRPRAITVAFYKGKAEGEPAQTVSGQLDGPGESLEFPLPPAGTWTVWIDANPYCPVVVPNVTFDDKAKDLGTLEVEEGTVVTIEVLLKEGASMPRMYAYAMHKGAPAFHRRADSGSATTFTLRGLPAGTFTLRVGSHMGGGGGAPKDIEVDGVTAIKHVVDLRK